MKYVTIQKRKTYDKDMLVRAVGAVKSKKLNPSQAAREFSVPRQTLVDHVNGRIDSFGAVSGPGHLLSPEEEAALVDYILYMADRGFPLNRHHLKTYATEIIKASGHNEPPVGLHFNPQNGPSDKWCRKFLCKHPNLAERIPEQRDKGRMKMSNTTVVTQFFKKYSKCPDWKPR